MDKKKVIIFGYFLNKNYSFTSNIVQWFNSMSENYLIDCDRQFVMCTDNIRVPLVLSGENIQFVHVDSHNTGNIGENKLNKFNHIYDWLKGYDKSFDFFCFVQSNARCLNKVTLQEMTNNKDLTIIRHCDSKKASFKALYYNKIGSVVDISNIQTNKFIYTYSGHFLAKKDVILNLCKNINGLIAKDRNNKDFNKWYPPNHVNKGGKETLVVYDETYWNYYLNETLMKTSCGINVLDGNIYAKAWYSSYRGAKVEMIRKEINRKYGMTITSQELMKYSIVISIDDARLDIFNRLFSAHGFKQIPQKMQGVCDSKNKPVINCYLSHRNAILKAKENNWPFVCVFEDDAYPIHGICEKLNHYLNDVPDACAVMVLGNSGVRSSKAFNSKLKNNMSCYGSHSYVVFGDYYDDYIRFLDSVKFADSFQFSNDSIIPKVKFFMPNENLFIQFCDKKSMNGHCGYIWRINGRKLTKEEIFQRGYRPIETYISHNSTAPGYTCETKTANQDVSYIKEKGNFVASSPPSRKTPNRVNPITKFFRFQYG